VTDRTGYTGNTFGPKGLSRGCRVFLLQIDVPEIVLHKAEQPNTFFDLLDTDSLASKDRAEVDFFAVETNAPAAGDVDSLVVKRVVEFRQSAVGAGGRGIDFRWAVHVEGLVGPHVVVLIDKTVELGLLLQILDEADVEVGEIAQ
jgi:hypothetical protein